MVTLVMPQTIRFEKTPDNANVGGAMYGAQLLAGCYGSTDVGTMPSLNAGTVQKTSSNPLKFTGTASTGSVTMVPFYQMHNQHYSVYWNLTNVPTSVAATRLENSGQGVPFAQLSAVSSRLTIGFSLPASRNTPITVALYALNGARVVNCAGALLAVSGRWL